MDYINVELGGDDESLPIHLVIDSVKVEVMDKRRYKFFIAGNGESRLLDTYTGTTYYVHGGLWQVLTKFKEPI